MALSPLREEMLHLNQRSTMVCVPFGATGVQAEVHVKCGAFLAQQNLSAVNSQQSSLHTQPVRRSVPLTVHADSFCRYAATSWINQVACREGSQAGKGHTSKQLSRSALNSWMKGKARAGRKATSPSTGAQWVKAERVRARRRIND